MEVSLATIVRVDRFDMIVDATNGKSPVRLQLSRSPEAGG